MKNVNIVFDFDGTVLDAPSFVKDFTSMVMEGNGIPKEVMKTFHDKSVPAPVGYTSKTHYMVESPEEFVDLYVSPQVSFNVDVQKIKADADAFLTNLCKYFFTDALELAILVPKENRFIVSRGIINWQNLKINRSNARSHFQEVSITMDKKSDIIKRLYEEHGQIVFIDDRGKEVDEVKVIVSEAVCILINRSNGKHNSETSELCDFQVNNLNEAKDIITTIAK